MQPAVNKRVRLIECRDQVAFQTFPILWKAPVADRGGVILKVNSDWVYIALDHGLNETPDKDDKDYARKVGINERHVLILERYKFGSSILADFSAAKDARGSEFVRCGHCKCPKWKNKCVLTCKRGHMCCREHIFSWNSCDNRHRELMCSIVEHLRSVQQALLFVEVRAVLAFRDLTLSPSPDHRDKILRAYASSEYWACPVCIAENCLHDHFLFNFGQIAEEIQKSDCLLREAFPQERGILIDLSDCIRTNLQATTAFPDESKIDQIYEDVCQAFLTVVNEKYHNDAWHFLQETQTRELMSELAREPGSIHSLHANTLKILKERWQIRQSPQVNPSHEDGAQEEEFHVVDIIPGAAAERYSETSGEWTVITETSNGEYAAQPKLPNIQRVVSRFGGRAASMKEQKYESENEESSFPQGAATVYHGAKETNASDKFQWKNQEHREQQEGGRCLAAEMEIEEYERQERVEMEGVATTMAMEKQQAEEYERQQRMEADQESQEKQRADEYERQQRVEAARIGKAALEKQRAEEYERQQRMEAEKVAQEAQEKQRADEYERQQRVEAARIGKAALEKQRAEEYERQQRMEAERVAQEAQEKQRADEYERQQRVEAARIGKAALEKQRAEEYERQQRMEAERVAQEALEKQRADEYERQQRVEAARIAQEAEEKRRAEATEKVKTANHQRQQIINEKIQNFKIRCRVSTGAGDDLLQSVVDSVSDDEWRDFRYDDFENAVFERISGGGQTQNRSEVSCNGRHEGNSSTAPAVPPKNVGHKIARRRNEIGTTCDVDVRIPECKKRAICTLYEGTGYEALFQELTAAAEIGRREFDQIVLFLVDNAGWSSEITRDEVATQTLEVCIGDIKAHSIIELRKHRIAAVSGKFVMMTIAASERFNESLQVKVRKMAETYSGYRKIRGDGNCYYRSVIYGLIEQLLISGNRQKGFRALIEIFTKLFCPSGELGDAKVAVISKFEEAARGDIWKTPEEFEGDILDEVGKLDINLIHLCKRMVSAFLNENKAKEYNGLSLNDAILPSFDVRNMTQFCKEYVMTLGVCAEGAHVDLGVLPSLLRCRSHIVILARERTSDLTILDTELSTFGFDDQESLADVHLLFRPGHYDLLYTHQQMPLPVHAPNIVDDLRQHQPSEPKNLDLSAEKNLSNTQISESGLTGNSADVTPSGPGPIMEKKSLSSVRPEERDIGSDDAHFRSGERHVGAVTEPMATVPVRGNSEESKSADALQQIQETLSVSEATALKLLNRCSTVAAALDYYFQNMELFTNESSNNGPTGGRLSAPMSVTSSVPVVTSTSSSAAASVAGSGKGSALAPSPESFVHSAEDVALLKQFQTKYQPLLLHSNISLAWTVREMGFDMRSVLESMVRINFRADASMIAHFCEQANMQGQGNMQGSANSKLAAPPRSSTDTQLFEAYRKKHRRFQNVDAEDFVYRFREITGFELSVILDSIVAVGFSDGLEKECKSRAAKQLKTKTESSASQTQSSPWTRDEQALLLKAARNYPLIFDDAQIQTELLKVKGMGFELQDAIECVIRYDTKRAETIRAQLQRNMEKGKGSEGNENSAPVIASPENLVPANEVDLADFFIDNDKLEFIAARSDFPNTFDARTVEAMIDARNRGYLMSDIINCVVHYKKKDSESIVRHIDDEKRNQQATGSGAGFKSLDDQVAFSSAGPFDVFTSQNILEVYAMGYPMREILGLVHRGIRTKEEIIRILLDGGVSSNPSTSSVSPEARNSSAPPFRSNEDQAAFYSAQLDAPTRQVVLQVYEMGHSLPEILRLVAAGARSTEGLIKRLSQANAEAATSNSSTHQFRNRADVKLYEDFKAESMYFRTSEVGDNVIWSVYDMGYPMSLILEAAKKYTFDKALIIDHCRRALTAARQPPDNQLQPPRQQSGPTDMLRCAFTGDDAKLFFQAKVKHPQVIDDWQEEEMRKARDVGCSMEEIIESLKTGKLSAENIVNSVNRRRIAKANVTAPGTVNGFRPADWEIYRLRKLTFPERFDAVTEASIREAYNLNYRMDDILSVVCFGGARTLDEIVARCTERSDGREYRSEISNRTSTLSNMYGHTGGASHSSSSMNAIDLNYSNHPSQMTHVNPSANYLAATDILSGRDPVLPLRSRLSRLGFSSQDVKNAVIDGQCRNLRSVFRWLCDQLNQRVPEHIQDRSRLREDDSHLEELYRTAVNQLQLSPVLTMEAIGFEECYELDDVIDSVHAGNLRMQGAQTPRDEYIDRGAPEDRRAKLLRRIESMSKPQMLTLCNTLNITDKDRLAWGPKQLRTFLRNFVRTEKL